MMNFDGSIFKNKVLEKNIISNTLQHSIILKGDEYNTFDTAINIARFLMCKNNGCLNCDNCNNIKENNHPDVFFIDKENGKSEITVDIIKNIKKNMSLKPVVSDYKIYIIKNSQAMNVNAQNALLKSLEEPFSFIKFILCCSSLKKLLPTVVSRCTIYNINSEKLSVDINKTSLNLSIELIKNILQNDHNNILLCITELFKDKKLYNENIDILKLLLKLIIDYKTKKIYDSIIPKDLLNLIDYFDINILFNIYDLVLSIEENITYHLNNNVFSIYIFIKIKAFLEE